MRIRSGPFQGLQYVPQSAGSAYFPKLLGTYEKELEHVVDGVIRRKPGVIVDAGAAEGYFAVGLATRCPVSRVIAYDMDIRACYFLQMLAEGNRVRDRVEIHCKPCKCEDLQLSLGGTSRPFLLMDVEGAEETLLDPQAVPALFDTEILVELHATSGTPDMAKLVAERFGATHKITVIEARPRTPEDSPIPLGPFRKAAESALDEGRQPGQQWMHLVPLSW